ncbi:GNAT family N-acetyltransferase [Solirubrobacter phytolaccae]|uniref:GNAT family N-acetyltransferase n=1 Tax=Solirubrobacter phytolaccae TaxID=1404360 RepID=A0A9X3SAD4_9ACTN|nr:GNAT family N-acetyltransferase [Solirubrobacter phytolaccae]MDA0183528.1 GNAT family N-acetyltransferase [Solirubrobacter phytolaccae]
MLVLRPPQSSDADALVAACQDPEIPRWTNVPSPYTRDHALTFIHRDDPRVKAFLGFEGDQLVGSFSLLEIDLDAHYGEVGYWVAKEARGRGIATQAVEQLKATALELGITRLELLAHKDNAGSRGVARKSGFHDTGELRPAPRVDPPTPPDYVVYAWSAE